MRTGRPTKPYALRELTGSIHRATNHDEPRPAGRVKIPRGLSKEARKHWRRLARILEPLGLLTPADQDSFGMLAHALSTIDKARSEIAKSGEVVAFRGRPIQNPYMTVLRGAEATALKLFGDFGMSPSARTRIWSAVNPPKPAHPAERDITSSYFEDEQPDSVQ